MYQDNEHNYYNSENDGYRPESLPSYASYQPPKRKRKQGGAGRILALILCCALVGGGAGVGGALVYSTYLAPQTVVTEYAQTTTTTGAVTTVASTSGTILSAADLYAQNVASCVGITVSNTATNAFGQVSTTAASGSGFVITDDGYIVTNCHVIADVIDYPTLTIDVTFYDGTSYPATLVGYEEDNDVAVLKIEATGLQAVAIGDSDELVVGETVYAIGNPLGELDFTLTDGLVSALDRLVSTDDDTTMNMFQTNTAINPGNSGGPLFNESGEVVGITTAKYSYSSSGTTVEGLGFALPINDVVDIVVDLIQYGYVTGKPYMGVQIVDGQYYGATAGAGVSYIAAGGAAETAGLETGDVIIALDGTVIDSASALTSAVTAYKAGESAQMTVVRGEDIITLTIVFDEKNTTTEAANQVTVEESTVETPSTDNSDRQMPSGGSRP